ncbi:MAG: VOC family protein, partial [Thermoanaerobaculia bacterium]
MELTHVTLVVRDVDRALDFYLGTLGFEKRADISNQGFRWLTVAQPGHGLEIVLLKGVRETAKHTGVAERWILGTDDCRRDFAALRSRGVKFEEMEPQDGYFGVNATFADPDGNRFMLRQMAKDQLMSGRVVEGVIVPKTDAAHR